MDKKLVKSILLIVTYCLILVVAVIRFDFIVGAVNKFFALLFPVFLGFAIAFVLNRPYMGIYKLYDGIGTAIKNKALKAKTEKKPVTEKEKPVRKKKKEHKNTRKIVLKILSLLTVYLLFIALIVLLLCAVIPELADSVKQFYTNIESYAQNITELADKIGEFLKIGDLQIIEPEVSAFEDAPKPTPGNILTAQKTTINDSINEMLTRFVENLPNYISGIVPNLFTFTKNLASSVYNWLIGFIMSIYMLASKESLISQCKRAFYSVASDKIAKKTEKVMKISNSIFSSFVTGRLLDSAIIAVLCFFIMTVFGFQYSMLISVMVGITNIIPVIGPFIGAIPSIFLLLMVDPMQGFWFTILILALQQLDGNLIGPKIVGDAIGLPAWWLWVSVIVSSGLWGLAGILIGVPGFAVIYQLASEAIDKKLLTKKNAGKDIQPVPDGSVQNVPDAEEQK